MFTVAQREQRQHDLIAMAHADDAIAGAALVGSSATGKQDAFSDTDLALQLAPDANLDAVIARWTTSVSEQFAVADTLDVVAGNGVLYRVFLTSDSMQIDISFWPHHLFRATGDRFRLLFGSPQPAATVPTPDPHHVIGMAWLYGIHVRSSIARNEPWHALSLLDDMRDFVLSMACIPNGLNHRELRDVDALSPDLLARFATARAADPSPAELQRSLRLTIDLLIDEIAAVDPHRAAMLTAPLRLVAASQKHA